MTFSEGIDNCQSLLIGVKDCILAGVALGGPQGLLPDVGTAPQEVHCGLDRRLLVSVNIVVLSSGGAS